VIWVLLLATAALSAVAGLLVMRANPGRRLPWFGRIPPSWSYIADQDPWSAKAARFASLMLGIFTASHGDADVGDVLWLWALAAMVVPLWVLQAFHNHQVRPPA